MTREKKEIIKVLTAWGCGLEFELGKPLIQNKKRIIGLANGIKQRNKVERAEAERIANLKREQKREKLKYNIKFELLQF